MFPELPGAWAAVVVIALTPAALRWWWGRALSRLADDPVLPERLAAHNRRVRRGAGGGAAVPFVGMAPWAVWGGPLLLFAQAAGGVSRPQTLHQNAWRPGTG